MPILNILKRLLIKLLKNEKITTTETAEALGYLTKPQPDTVESEGVEIVKNLEFCELSPQETIYLAIPFIKAALINSKADLLKYIGDILKIKDLWTSNDSEIDLRSNQILNYSSEEYFDPQRVFSDILQGKLNRSDKIHMSRTIANFQINYVDWEDREFLCKLTVACLYKALLLLRSLQNEEEIYNLKDVYSDDERKQSAPQMYTFMPCGHLNPIDISRKSLLKRRFEPTLTLEDYSRSLLAKQTGAGSGLNKMKEESDIEKLRKKDEFDEFRRNFRGNTKDIG